LQEGMKIKKMLKEIDCLDFKENKWHSISYLKFIRKNANKAWI
jgi:hypothetical protein